ncbi:serine hydrolase domain-containing protein [Microbacterium halotolerans]|uniref:serine hydrolase domain-containing protein n=1 Tax=Microbacterium halotolerans TaxID=246613 RepID=UPI000E6AAD05|nr:serine hydrolase domain-containing protein [Microbacterium halotolerans]
MSDPVRRTPRKSALLQPVADGLIAPRSDSRSAPEGAVFAIVEGGDGETAASGVADLRSGEHARVDHVQDTASVGKTLTTLAAQALISRGELHADDALGRLLGGRAGVHADATVDELLRHRGGVAPWWPVYLLPDAGADPLAAALRVAPGSPRDQRRAYSDLGMQAVGGVVSAVTGLSFADAVRALVLDPLGAETVVAAGPLSGRAAFAGADGDAIEEDMVRSGDPYPIAADANDAVTAAADAFGWRRGVVRDEIGDGNAFHAYRGAAGHAGWFADADGLLRVADALAEPARLGIDAPTAAAMTIEHDPGQGRGMRTYLLPWRGRRRLFVGHPGFTGAFVAAAAAEHGDPPVRVAMLTNRLHGDPVPERTRLAPVEQMWRDAMAAADHILHPTTGARR